MITVDESELQALVDGCLPASRRGDVERYLAERPELLARVRLDRRLRDQLRHALAGVLAAPTPARLQLDRLRARRRRRRRARMLAAAIGAALFLAGALVGWMASHAAP